MTTIVLRSPMILSATCTATVAEYEETQAENQNKTKDKRVDRRDKTDDKIISCLRNVIDAVQSVVNRHHAFGSRPERTEDRDGKQSGRCFCVNLGDRFEQDTLKFNGNNIFQCGI